MKKHLLFLFAAFATLMANAHDFEVDGIYYNITSEEAKTAEVTYQGDNPYDGGWYSGSITLPATVTYDGVAYSVTSIGNHAFYGCSSLISITIPEDVTSIGKGAFRDCDVLAFVTIPENSRLTLIGDWAFSYCCFLESITLPESVTSIGEYAFDHCISLKRIKIPKSVTSIGNCAFRGCDKLKIRPRVHRRRISCGY